MAMTYRALLRAFLLLAFSYAVSAQVLSFPSSQGGAETNMASSALNLVQATRMDNNLWTIDSQARSPLESPNGSLSKLDLKAPWKARREYDKGYQLLMRKDLPGAVQHLTIATVIYPSFVAAHNALGSAYLGLGQNDQARGEFFQAVTLDDHLPNSYLNLGCAELALKHFSAAQESMQKAAAIAPLDLQLLTALAYGQLMNGNYDGTITTAHQVHDRKHEGSAMVHFYAAAAFAAQGSFSQAQDELKTLLREDPKSPAAQQAIRMMEQLKDEQNRALAPAPKITFTEVPSSASTAPAGLPESFRKLVQNSQEEKEKNQIAEAEAVCLTCETTAGRTNPEFAPGTGSLPQASGSKYAGWTLRSNTDEVAVFFAATDHGKSVTNLTGKDIGIRDDRKAPAAVTSFRNESELPLRLALVIDTSDSIASRFKFEQNAATNFLQKVVTGPKDLAFVVGFANSILLVQDFTDDQKLISRAVGQLAPSGGTSLWDAVAFAADKLASRQETQPVARVVVIISDGEDNSSSTTLKEAISRAQHGEVTIYTVSTREAVEDAAVHSLVGEHALQTLADLTGGASFTPGSIHRLDGSLVDLQQVIRSRYLVSYKPALFKRDGHFREIDITAAKDGHKLRIYARKGYFVSMNSSSPTHF
jgi:Ca-activated chloride channel homolog